MSVYSVRFFNGPVTNNQTLFTCPAGFVCILSNLECYNTTGGSLTFLIALSPSPGVTSGMMAHVNDIATMQVGQWSGHSVFRAGEALVYIGPSSPGSVTAHGYQLVAGPP